MKRVLVSCVQMQGCFDAFRPQFEAAGLVADLPKIPGQHLSPEELGPIIGGYDGVIAGDDLLTKAVLERASRLRVISKWGVGMDSIDLEAARELGIVVTNTPHMFDDEVADVTIGYLIMLARGLHLIDRAVRGGEWRKLEGRSLGGSTLGVVGLGGIGRGTARRAIAMGMVVVGSDPNAESAARAAELGVRVVPFAELLRTSDALALNCPLTSETRGLLDRESLALTRDGILIVNTSRGAVIDEAALIEALRTGRVAAAALDVFEEEPLPPTSPLREMDQVVLGSHNASNTSEAVVRTSAQAVSNLLEHLVGSTG